MDFVKDNNPRHLKQVEGMLGEFPDFVKNAYDKSDATDIEELDRSAFAKPAGREFPIDTKEHTFLSYAYYKSAKLQDKEVEENIKKAAKLHDVDLSVIDNNFLEKKASQEEVAKQFALTIDVGEEGGGVRYYYPVNNTLAIEKSARDLSEDFHKIPLEAFRHAASNIVKAAKVSGIALASLPDRVKYTGADREFSNKYAQQGVRQRERTLGKEAVEIYKEILKSASVDLEHVNDYIDLFTDLDRANGVEYSENMLNPYELFFSGHDRDTVKAAANAYVVVYDAPIPLDEFTKRARARVEKNFTSENSEKLLETVKIAEEQGGIAASGKLIEFPKELQRDFLETLVDVGMNHREKYARSKKAGMAPAIGGQGWGITGQGSTSGGHDGANSMEMAPPEPTEPEQQTGIPGSGGLGQLAPKNPLGLLAPPVVPGGAPEAPPMAPPATPAPAPAM